MKEVLIVVLIGFLTHAHYLLQQANKPKMVSWYVAVGECNHADVIKTWVNGPTPTSNMRTLQDTDHNAPNYAFNQYLVINCKSCGKEVRQCMK